MLPSLGGGKKKKRIEIGMYVNSDQDGNYAIISIMKGIENKIMQNGRGKISKVRSRSL